MKKLFICQIVDYVSETIVSTFTAPTGKYFERQMEAFFTDCRKKGIPVADFVGFIVASVDVCESFNDAVAFLDDNDADIYRATDCTDLKPAGETE